MVAPQEQQASASWSVAATIRARQDYVDDFIAYYTAMGACEIIIFFDDPSVRAYNVEAAPIVTPVVCDAAYWQAVGMVRPAATDDRQMVNLRYAVRRTKAQWLLNVDLDERVHADGRVDRILGQQPPALFSIAVPPFEAIYAEVPPIEAAFRTPWFKTLQPDSQHPLLREMHGELVALTNRSFFSHTSGKYFVRTDLPAKDLKIHFATAEDPALRAHQRVAELELLHFDALTFADFQEKWGRRIAGKDIQPRLGGARRQQLNRITAAANDDAALFAIYRQMYVVPPPLLAKAVEAGLIVRRPAQPAMQ